MPRTVVMVDETVPADAANHDVDIKNAPPLASILRARQIDNGVPAEVDLTVVTADPTGDDEIYLKDSDTITIRVGTAIATDDFLILECEEVGENVKVA